MLLENNTKKVVDLIHQFDNLIKGFAPLQN